MRYYYYKESLRRPLMFFAEFIEKVVKIKNCDYFLN